MRKIFLIRLICLGIGDALGCLLAEVLSDLPMIDSINLSANNLTDRSLSPLISSITTIPSVTVLNLSKNKIDGLSSIALANYLSRPDCPIVSLNISSADVDDTECVKFVKALRENDRLTYLDISCNLLGKNFIFAFILGVHSTFP